MRCTPVNQWKTRRKIISTSPTAEGHELDVADPWAETDVQDFGEQGFLKPEKKRTYSTSYDVSFIFEHLWRKCTVDTNGNKCSPQSCTGIRLPDTVVYRSGYPAAWYFHSKVDGRLLRKKPESIYIPRIFEVFGAENGTCETEVVAMYVGTMKTKTGPVNTITYYDRKRLKDFLFGENVSQPDGFLQRFVAPEAMPMEGSARNSTLHATWSPYHCSVENLVNLNKLDAKIMTSAKVNVAFNCVENSLVNSDTKLFKKIFQQCQCISDHIKNTSVDQVEVLNMNCYYKVGEKGKLYFLLCSAVSVAPKFQDAFGFIPSLRTFTRMHSPEMQCPDYASDNNFRCYSKNRCSLCNAEGESKASYTITYRMIAEKTAAERERLLVIDSPKPVQETVIKTKTSFELSDLYAKAGAIFSILDIDNDGRILLSELQSGLIDLGYTPDEIEVIFKAVDFEIDSEDEYDVMTLSRFYGCLSALVDYFSEERFTKFANSVDMTDLLDGDAFEGVATQKPVVKQSKRERIRHISKQVPKILVNLQQKLNVADLKRILCFEENADDEDFANKTLLVCKKCAMQFNADAKGVFEWRFQRLRDEQDAKVRRKIQWLKNLQSRVHLEMEHNYPVAEIPFKCTPRMYEALHSHTSRSARERCRQVTAVGSKDLISIPEVWPNHRPHRAAQLERSLPVLPLLKLSAALPVPTEYDRETLLLLDRLGLTSRGPRSDSDIFIPLARDHREMSFDSQVRTGEPTLISTSRSKGWEAAYGPNSVSLKTTQRAWVAQPPRTRDQAE